MLPPASAICGALAPRCHGTKLVASGRAVYVTVVVRVVIQHRQLGVERPGRIPISSSTAIGGVFSLRPGSEDCWRWSECQVSSSTLLLGRIILVPVLTMTMFIGKPQRASRHR